MSTDAGSTFFRLISLLKGETQLSKIITVLQDWENISALDFPNRLIEFLYLDPWPGNGPDNMFYMIVTAAENSKSLAWLEEVCKRALIYAESHLPALALRACIIFLRNITNQPVQPVNGNIEAVTEVCADKVDICLQKMRAFCPSKTRPFDIPSKIKYMERGSLHLAMILRKRGRDKEAVEQLLPFIAAARKLLEDITKHNYHYYSQTFTEIYSALGKDKEA